MKKALSVLLAMLMIFSMASVMAFAEETKTSNFVTYVFENNGVEYAVVEVDPTTDAFVSLTPYVPANPTRESTETTEYLFKGWAVKGTEQTGPYYYQSTIPAPTADDIGKEFVYVAVYSEKEITGNQSFWKFVESIFERINLLFRYFATIFEW